MREFKLLKDNPLGHATETYTFGLVIFRGFLFSLLSNDSDTSWMNSSAACSSFRWLHACPLWPQRVTWPSPSGHCGKGLPKGRHSRRCDSLGSLLWQCVTALKRSALLWAWLSFASTNTLHSAVTAHHCVTRSWPVCERIFLTCPT